MTKERRKFIESYIEKCHNAKNFGELGEIIYIFK